MFLLPSAIGAIQQDPLRRIFKQASLDLQFAETKSLVDATTGRNLVTFTRASSGTYVGSDGLIKTATTNLLPRSEEFDISWTRAGILAFGSGSTSDVTTAPNGVNSADLITEDTATSSVHRLMQSGLTVSAVSYTVSVYAKRANGTRNLEINANTLIKARAVFDLGTGTVGEISSGTAAIQSVGNGWYRCSVTGVSSGTTTSVYLQLATSTTASSSTYTGDGTSGLYLWGAQLEQSSTAGEYIPTTSTINSAPRFDHDPVTGESLGLLVEEQRTNALLQSNGFDTTWTNSLTSETANAGTAPDGTNAAWELKDTVDATASQHLLSQTPANFVSGTSYTFSVWAKSGTLSHIALTFPASAFGATLTSRYSLATGTAVSVAAGTTATVTAFPDGWYRVTTTATATASASGVLNIRLALAGTTLYQGDGNGTILVWGAQLEAGAFPTSYIPTTTATVTRAADVASISGANFSSWYRQDEGTMFASWTAAGFTIRPVTVNDGTGNNAISVATTTTSAGQSIYVSGSFQGTAGITGSYLSGTPYRQVSAYRSNDAVDGINGTLGVVDTSCSVPSVTQALIGQGRNGASQPSNGTIRRLTYWPQRLPNETLQAVTQ